MKRLYVDPEGPDGWIKDECPVCGATSGQRCRAATLVGWDAARERSEPHMAREHAWSARRAREQGGGS